MREIDKSHSCYNVQTKDLTWRFQSLICGEVDSDLRYDLVDGQWIYKHDGHIFHERLARELATITGKADLQFELEPQVLKGFSGGYGPDPTWLIRILKGISKVCQSANFACNYTKQILFICMTLGPMLSAFNSATYLQAVHTCQNAC